MTKEQRLMLLKLIEEQIYVSSLESTLQDDMKSVAIHSIIDEEIERIENKNNQESMLDKIRAEIAEMSGAYDGNYIYRVYALEIIDKYKTESEDSK